MVLSSLSPPWNGDKTHQGSATSSAALKKHQIPAGNVPLQLQQGGDNPNPTAGVGQGGKIDKN